MIREGIGFHRSRQSSKKWPFILPQMAQIAFRIDKETLGDAVMISLRVLDPLHAFFPDLVQYGIGNPHQDGGVCRNNELSLPTFQDFENKGQERKLLQR